jgi:hypothetical protein
LPGSYLSTMRQGHRKLEQLGYYIQRPPKRKELTVEEKPERGFYGFYNRLVGRAIQHRWLVSAQDRQVALDCGLSARRDLLPLAPPL